MKMDLEYQSQLVNQSISPALSKNVLKSPQKYKNNLSPFLPEIQNP